MSRWRFSGLMVDFAGVLTTGIRESIQGWCVGQGLAADAWRHELEVDPHGRERYRALESGRMSQADWNRATARALGLDRAENLMGRAWAGVRPAENVIALVTAARQAGMRLALVSNSFGLDPYDPYAHLGVWDLFDVAVISEQVGVAKPDPEIYRIALERMGLPGPACVFIDDQHVNLPPAAALGITTVHAAPGSDYLSRLTTLLALPQPTAPQPRDDASVATTATDSPGGYTESQCSSRRS